MSGAGNFRLPAPWGTRLDRARPVDITFDGSPYGGFAGDTIASALMANGVKLLSRSFKYHRPRGVLTMAGQDGHALVQVGNEPNVRADVRAIEPGLEVEAQNVFGSLRFDAAGVLDYMGGMLPVGFYYKAFHRPRGAWRLWEPMIRRMAGLGRIDRGGEHRAAWTVHAATEVAVVGAGPAGLAAALEAAQTGARVALIEREPVPGGSADHRRDADVGGLKDEVAGHERITVYANTTCTGWFADNLLTLMAPGCMIKLRAGTVVLATGALGQPAVFRNNDLPGVMLGSAAQRLVHLYGVLPGRRAVLFTADDRGFEVAADLRDAGVEVVAIVDSRADGGSAGEVAVDGGVAAELKTGYGVGAALRGRDGCVRALEVARLDGEGRFVGGTETLPCDLVCVSAGEIPAAQLACHCGGRMYYEEDLGTLAVGLPADLDTGFMAGAVNGARTLESALADGRAAGRRAAGAANPGRASAAAAVTAGGMAALGPTVFPHDSGRDFVDFDEDLQVKDLERAVAEGYDDLELLKRYSTVVMGPSQGKQSALNNLRVATAATGRSADEVSLTTQRPPFYPEPVRLLGGRSMDPVRRTPMHHRHEEAGATLVPAGAWLRPGWYGPREHEAACIEREVEAVRTAAGLIDVSTLGKLELRGPDAAELMNRMYTFGYLKQPVGRIRYALMTDETGAIIDDGISCRIADDVFYVTATTSGVDDVYRSMLRWNAQWCLDVTVSNLTPAIAAINIAGPRSRLVLEALGTDIDVSPEGFPYLHYREGKIAGIPARVLRIGFVGELGFELHVPAEYGEALWDMTMAVGASRAMLPVGVEAQRVLRLEKGHLIVGQDTDGLTVPHHAGMEWAVAHGKPFFVGKRAIEIIARRGLDRRLVGFRAQEQAPPLEASNLVIRDGEIVGRITSVAYSRACGAIVGLAYVAADQSAPGTAIHLKHSDGSFQWAEVVTTPFFDPNNRRQEL